MSASKKKKPTRADLERQIMELHAQLAHIYHYAAADLPKAGTKHMMASGVLLRLDANGGRQLIPPVMIKDGLSEETIAAIHRDIVRSYELTTAFKPKGVAP